MININLLINNNLKDHIKTIYIITDTPPSLNFRDGPIIIFGWRCATKKQNKNSPYSQKRLQMEMILLPVCAEMLAR